MNSIIPRRKTLVKELAVWLVLVVAVIVVSKTVPRGPSALSDAARTREGCVQWAEQHDDDVLVRKCRANAPIQELLDHVAQTRHAGLR